MLRINNQTLKYKIKYFRINLYVSLTFQENIIPFLIFLLDQVSNFITLFIYLEDRKSVV